MMIVNEVLAWWMARMRELLPGRLRDAGLRGPALIADVRPNLPGIALCDRRGRAVPVPRRAGPAQLRLPSGAVLERMLVLPAAAEPELARVVGYEVDRISPFNRAEVAVAHMVAQRDRASGRLHVLVALLPVATLGPAREALRAMGLQAESALAPRSSGGMWHFGLEGPNMARHGRRWAALSAACCAVLAFATVATPYAVQQAALDRADARIAALRPDVEQAAQLRRRIAGSSQGVDAITAEVARVGQAVQIMATLTSLLPDDTYLTSLGIKQRVLTMSGRSAAATRLIPLLSTDPSIRNATFAAPVTRVEGLRGDVFSLRAEFGS